jgi:4-amino-4-deoxy-L-arabinose transferase-like glycosyltransferase
MSRPMLSSREAAIWAVCFLAISSLLVATRFASDDPDSALYASLSARLAETPVSHWIAPEWWGYWDGTGLFREHPAGIFWLPAVLGRLGMPTVQAAYVVGVAAGLGTLLLIGWLVNRLTSPADARAVLLLLQLMPVAFLFRIRANHEYPMLVCLLLTLVGLDRVRQSWPWLGLVVFGLTFALLIKGVFVVLIVVAAGLWIGLNPTRARGSVARPILACLVSAGVMAVVALAYDSAYLGVTGEAFWGPYWRRQLGPLTIATPVSGATTLGSHLAFYVSRMLWHPAPWSLVLLVVAWQWRRQLGSMWRAAPEAQRRGLVFAMAFVALVLALLSPSSRFAERYAFSAVYCIGTVGAVVARRAWPAFSRLLTRFDERIPALPAVVWTALMVLRLTVGPFLPRIP